MTSELPEPSPNGSAPTYRRWIAVYVLSVALMGTTAAAAWMYYVAQQAGKQARGAAVALAANKKETARWRERLRLAQTQIGRTKNDIQKLRSQLSLKSNALAAAQAETTKARLELQQGRREAGTNDNVAAPKRGGVAQPVPPPVGGTIIPGANPVSSAASAIAGTPRAATPPPRPQLVLQPAKGTRTVVSSVNVRAEPTTKSAVVKTLRPGQQIQLLAKTADESWHQVLLADNVRGFIKTTAMLKNSK